MSEYECTEHLLDEIERLREANFELREGELRQRIKQLEAVVNDPEALWTNWLRGTVKLPSGIGDVRQYQERIKRLVDVLGKAELAVAFANREHGVIRMMADDYTEVLQQIRVALKSNGAKP